MKFAIKTNPQNTTWAAVRETWVAADEVEVFEAAWSFDHFYPIFSDPTGPCLEGWTTLAALAEATDRIRLGLMVTGMPYRHPAVLANMASAVDIVSKGRLELGLGAGWNEEEANAYGISLGADLTERFDMFDEGVEAIVGLLTQETTSFRGDHVQLNDARNSPKPIQQPHPPITIGGAGEKRTLRTVARFAQHWNFPFGPVEDFRRKRDVLDYHCSAIGRDPSEITSSTMILVEPEPDLDAVLDQVDVWDGTGIDTLIFNVAPPHGPAKVEALAAAIAGHTS